MDHITIRTERPEDYAHVEGMIRRAFWNLYIPGCFEHYLARSIRTHEDFIPELDLVLEDEGRIVGSIMYTRARLIDEAGREKPVLTFGPVCVEPDFQRRGYGKRLMEESFRRARAMGWEAVVIFGSPANYVARGFRSSHRFRVATPEGSYPAAMLVKELTPGALAGHAWRYHQSPAFDDLDEAEARRYDETLPPLEKKELPCQEEFYILSHAVIQA